MSAVENAELCCKGGPSSSALGVKSGPFDDGCASLMPFRRVVAFGSSEIAAPRNRGSKSRCYERNGRSHFRSSIKTFDVSNVEVC
jgi:hypothetical protein